MALDSVFSLSLHYLPVQSLMIVELSFCLQVRFLDLESGPFSPTGSRMLQRFGCINLSDCFLDVRAGWSTVFGKGPSFITHISLSH